MVLKSHPKEVVQNEKADDLTSKQIFGQKSFLARVVNKIKKMIQRMK
jgi:hypothetical protein